MSRVIDANHKQLFLLPVDMEDWIPNDDPARFIQVFVDALDMKELHLVQLTVGAGRPAYANSLLLKVWLYGRMHKMRSSRDMERGCYRDIGLIWLTGMIKPDHNTIWRFGKSNETSLKELLKSVVSVAIHGGLVGFVLQALDGTKIKADIAKGRGCSRSVIKRVLSNLDRIVDELGAPDDTAPSTEEYRLPDKLSDPAQLSLLVHQLLKADKKGETVPLEPGLAETLKERLSVLVSEEEGIPDPVDPDARIMKCDTTKQLGYNAEVVVDEQYGLIVAADVTQENNDRRQLGPMIQAVKETAGQCAETTVADGDYLSGPQLAQAEHLGATVLVNDQSASPDMAGPYHQSAFTYDAIEDCYICPRGHKLPFRRSRAGTDGVSRDREYVCQQHDCPAWKECTSRQDKGRIIRRSAFADELERNRERITQPENKELLMRRKTIVELVFGHIKHNEGYRRWRVRGLSSVRAEWMWIAIVYNLKKMYALWRTGTFQVCLHDVGALT